MNGSYTSFASSHDDIYFCNESNAEIDVFNSVGMDLKSSYDFKNVISKVSDVLVINGMLFISGFECNVPTNNKYFKIIKIGTSLRCHPLVIYKFLYNQTVVKLSKSSCHNIHLMLFNKIMLISQDGNVKKSIDLPFYISNVLQLDDQNYFVCCQNHEICIIDDFGLIIKKCSPTNDCHKMLSPCLAVDNYGNIYMGERNILVVGRLLSFESLHVLCDVNEKILKISYNEGKGMLLVFVEVSKSKKILMLKI